MNTPHPGGSTTLVILRFVQGQVDEINELVRRHWGRMLAMARAFRRRHRVSEVDYADDDAANDAAFALCEQAKAGRLESIQDRSGLWQRYASILERKILLARRRTMRRRRGGEGVHRAGQIAHLDTQVGDEPTVPTAAETPATEPLHEPAAPRGWVRVPIDSIEQLLPTVPPPEDFILAADQFEALLNVVDDPFLQTTLILVQHGYSMDEIAKIQGVVRRTIERKFVRIREIMDRRGFGR